MPFGQLVVGSPGAGKTTYCAGAQDFLAALGRKAHVVNLDPANDSARLPYDAAIDINSLIKVKDVMTELLLGPNGALLYCIEYLQDNIQWLLDALDALPHDAYVIFDLPGQVELSTNHSSLKSIIQQLERRADYRLVALHLVDASHITDASRYVALVLLSLRAMLALELPHINVLSKIDLLGDMAAGRDDGDGDGDSDSDSDDDFSCADRGAREDGMRFNLSYYTRAQDLSRLLDSDGGAATGMRGGKYDLLNERICEVVEDFGLVSFETLAVEDKRSMLRLTRAVDKAGGYVFVSHETAEEQDERLQPGSVSATMGGMVPPPRAGAATAAALFGTAAGEMEGWGDAGDVQERWLDNRDAWDEHEAREGQARADEALEKRVYREANQVIQREREQAAQGQVS